jgi:hypothetical protein
MWHRATDWRRFPFRRAIQRLNNHRRDGRLRVGPPFFLWQVPDLSRSAGTSAPNVSLRLGAGGLQIHYAVAGVFLTLCVAGLYTRWWILVILLWMTWLYPWIVFRALKPSMPPMSAIQHDWVFLRLVPQIPKGKGLLRPLRGLSACIPAWSSQPAVWQPAGSYRGALTKLVLNWFFATDGGKAGTSDALWCDRGFWRWIGARCGPVVAGQAVWLVVVCWRLLAAANGGSGTTDCAK